MFERQQDAMSYIRLYQRPHLFITMTTNPKWTEIRQNLQQGYDRPDFAVRVFNLKLKKLMHLLKNRAFGQSQIWLYSLEIQKKRLATCAYSCLAGNRKQDLHQRPWTASFPQKFQIETSSVIYKHDSWSMCRYHSVCSMHEKSIMFKRFPKAYLKETEHGADSYPKYRRRSPEDGENCGTVNSAVNGQQIQRTVDTSFAVSCNLWFLRQRNCNINVEICISVESIIYVLKSEVRTKRHSK